MRWPWIANIKCFKLCAIVVLSLVVSYCTAQDQADTLTYYIQITDGNTYMGQILARDSLEILFPSPKKSLTWEEGHYWVLYLERKRQDLEYSMEYPHWDQRIRM